MVSPVQSPPGHRAVWLMPASLLVMLATSVVSAGAGLSLAPMLIVQGVVGIALVGWVGALWLGVDVRPQRPDAAEGLLAAGAGVGVGAVGSGFVAVAWSASPLVRDALAAREAMQSQIALGPGMTGAVVAALTLCAVPALSEELLYRGTLRGALAGWSRARREWAVAGLFAAAHVDWVLFAPLLLVGWVLGRVAAHRGWALSAIAHVSLNGFGVFVWARLYSEHGPSPLVAVVWALFGGAVCAAALIGLEAHRRRLEPGRR